MVVGLNLEAVCNGEDKAHGSSDGKHRDRKQMIHWKGEKVVVQTNGRDEILGILQPMDKRLTLLLDRSPIFLDGAPIEVFVEVLTLLSPGRANVSEEKTFLPTHATKKKMSVCDFDAE